MVTFLKKKAESGDDNLIDLEDVSKMFDNEDREAIGDIYKSIGSTILLGNLSDDIIESPLLSIIRKSISRPKMQQYTKNLDEDGRVDISDATSMIKNDESTPIGIMVIALGASIEKGDFDMGKIKPYTMNILKKIIKRPSIQRDLVNPIRLRNKVLKAISDNANRKLKTDTKNQVINASEPETPESSRKPVKQVREVSASTNMKESDIDFETLYDKRETEREEGSTSPENSHHEMMNSLNQGLSSAGGLGKEAMNQDDLDQLSKLY